MELKDQFNEWRQTALPNSDEVKQARLGKKTVAMVGMATTSRHLAPYDDATIPIWALNESATPRFDYLKRVDRIYQLHPEWDFLRPTNHNYDKYPEWLKEKHPLEIIMQDDIAKEGKYPSAKPYPLKEIVDMFGETALYFTSSVCYLIAHALYEEYQRIELYGFEMAADEEYANQKPAAEFWLGVAVGKGVDIYLPPGSALLGKEMQLYGYEMLPGILPMHVELRKNAIRQQLAEQERLKAEAEGKKKDLIVRLKASQSDPEKQELIKQITQIDMDVSLVIGRINFCSGVMSEIRNEENSLNGHLAKFEDVRSKKAMIYHAKRDVPAVKPEPVVAAPTWNIDEKPGQPTAPKKKRHHR